MTAPPAHLHVESIQTAIPIRIAVERGRTLPIAVSGTPPITAEELQRRFRVVLYYRDADGDHRPDDEARARLEQATWVQEALSAALSDEPKMAGRLRRRSRGDGPWEVKLNDSGLRLLTASADTPMTAFLEAGDRESKEAALALWTDVDTQDPEMCAPFFMQLTWFSDGGYAIGACCSLLHADPLSLINFLKTWARAHAEVQQQSKLVLNPVIRYTRYFRSPRAATKRLRSFPLVPTADGTTTTTTVLFRIVGDDAPADRGALADACVAQASEKLGLERPARFTVLAGDGLGGLNVVRACKPGGDGETTPQCPVQALRVACWNEAGLEEVVLDGCKPLHVSCGIVSPCADEGLVVVMPAAAGCAEFFISATVPS
ncbi:uncharacterized protein LOC124671519 [Lolium rigidum]|uniref:uncharacterized protein LOC124671519 n=1 Tax=Lolium rigidum TaxID=89674 RepID=UPI001F5DD53A|nr:uncharacterized protein LOC124671519 [Lolium rigidum]